MPDPFPPAPAPPSSGPSAFSVATRFSLSEKEYLEAQRLYIRFRQKRAVLVRRLATATLAVSLVLLFFTMPHGSFHQQPAALLMLFLLIVLLVTPYGQLRALKGASRLSAPISQTSRLNSTNTAFTALPRPAMAA